MSVISEADHLHLIEIGVLPPKELCSWKIWHGVTVPTEDTHEAVIFVPFLFRGLALAASPFFRGLLDFYSLNLTHLNPNFVLQILYTFIFARLSLGSFLTLGFGSISTTVGPGWLEDNNNLLAVLAWNFTEAGRLSILASLRRTVLKDGTSSGLP
jgi:hypothetical protein